MVQKIDVSTSTLLRIFLIVFCVVFLYLVRDILAILLFSIIIASGIDPFASWLSQRKIPRALAVVFVYLVFIAILGLIIYFVIPPLVSQIKDFSRTLPEKWERFNLGLQSFEGRLPKDDLGQNISKILEVSAERLGQAARSIASAASGIFGGIFSAFAVLIISFYLAVRKDGIDKFLEAVTPHEHHDYILNLWKRTQRKMGRWLQGQLVLSLIIGITVFLGLTVLGVPYALFLGLLAGLLEIIPYVGPIVSGAIGSGVAFFTVSPLAGLIAVAMYVLIQQLENYILVPKVMQKAVGLNPVVVILALLVGQKLGGVPGLVLSVPLAGAIAEFLKDLKK